MVESSAVVVRLLRSPVGLSVVAHAALFGVLALTGDDAGSPPERRGSADLELITIEVSDAPRAPDPGKAPAPITATETPTTPAAATAAPRGSTPRPPASAPKRGPMRVATATDRRPTTSTPREPTLAPPPPRGDGPDIVTSPDSVMHMRDYGRRMPGTDIPRGPTGFDVRAAARSVVPAPKPPPVAMMTPALPGKEPDTGLRASGGGTHEYDDIAFDAKVSADGRVTIKDKPNLRAHIALPGPRDVGRHIAAWYRDPKGVATGDARAVETGTVPIVGGSFDVTDWAMRAAGMDPYLHRKAKMLDRTRPVRFTISAKWRGEVLRDSVAQLPGYLERIWRYSAWSAPKRRRILFELWDEADERGTTARARSGRAARATILGFIRRRLPAGNPLAYPADELQALNRRRKSRARFAPYATESGQ